MSGRRAGSPWAPGDERTLALVALTAAAALLVSWTGVSGQGVVREQTAWLAVGIAGLVILGVGSLLWLLAGRQAVAARRSLVLREVVAHLPMGRLDVVSAGHIPPVPGQGGTPSLRAGLPAAVPGTARYHRQSCVFVLGKEAPALAAQEHEAAGRVACEVCAP